MTIAVYLFAHVINNVEFPSPLTVDTSSPCFFVLAGSTPSPAHLKTHNPPKKLTLRCEMLQTAWTFPPRQWSTIFDRRQTTTYPIAHCLPSSKASSVIPLPATYSYWIQTLATYFGPNTAPCGTSLPSANNHCLLLRYFTQSVQFLCLLQGLQVMYHSLYCK